MHPKSINVVYCCDKNVLLCSSQIAVKAELKVNDGTAVTGGEYVEVVALAVDVP